MTKFIIARGIGFSPGSVKYIPTLGFASAQVLYPHTVKKHFIRSKTRSFTRTKKRSFDVGL